MAVISKGILGGFSGKVGTVVGANWRGKDIIRSLPIKKNRKASDLQMIQRMKFKLVSQFMAPLNQLTSKYFGEYQGTKSRTNLAMSHHLTDAVEEINDQLVINYSKVVITKAVLPSVSIDSSDIQNDILEIAWTSNAGVGLAKAADKLVVIIYSQTHNSFHVVEDIATRADGTISTPMPNGWPVGDNSVWICLTDEIGRMCSTSEYLGEL